jgi:hypothetical protein
MATSENIKHVKEVAEVLGVDKCFMYKAMKRRFWLLNMPMWSVEKCVQRSNVVDKNVKDLVTSWWISQTTISLNKMDVISLCISHKQYICHARHYLQESQVYTLCFLMNFKV